MAAPPLPSFMMSSVRSPSIPSGSTSTASSDDICPSHRPSQSAHNSKHATTASKAHNEWQKLRYNRRSAASASPDSSAPSTPPNGPTSPQHHHAMPAVMIALTATPRPSFMGWAALSTPPAPAAAPKEYVSPLAEWTLRR